jgi:hypothetical protein
MWWAGIITIIGGILAASSFIIKSKPNAKELIDKLVPYQGWVGIAMFCWGVFETIGVITSIGWLGHHPLNWIFRLLEAVADLGVGFLLGFSLISQYALSKSPEAMARGQQLRGKLVGVQIPLGFLAIGIGLVYVVLGLVVRF